jgi:hypothetical protein
LTRLDDLTGTESTRVGRSLGIRATNERPVDRPTKSLLCSPTISGATSRLRSSAIAERSCSTVTYPLVHSANRFSMSAASSSSSATSRSSISVSAPMNPVPELTRRHGAIQESSHLPVQADNRPFTNCYHRGCPSGRFADPVPIRSLPRTRRRWRVRVLHQKDSTPSDSHQGTGARSVSVCYLDSSGFRIFIVHFYLVRDGHGDWSIGASGETDPSGCSRAALSTAHVSIDVARQLCATPPTSSLPPV